MVREGDWKLLLSPRDHNRPEGREPSGKLFRANVAEDPGESKNLAKDHPEVVARLTKVCSDWHKTLPPDNGPNLVRKPKKKK